MKGNAIEKLYGQLVRQAKGDPKKATILGVLLLIMAVVIVKSSSSSPSVSSANINVPRSPIGSDPPKPPNNKPSSGAALAAWARGPIPPALSRNLFVVNYECFPQDGTKPVLVRISHGDGFWDQLAKSMASRADLKMEREVLLANMRTEAEKLKVQSTMMGASPKALINGELVSEGDVVASFRVSKIEPRRIVLEREGIKLEKRLD
jgi:hypothetical protein